jgi:hypothetical protein
MIIAFVLGFFLKTLMPFLIWVLVTVGYYSLEYAYREIMKSPRLENFKKEYSLILDLRENKFSYVEIALPLQMLALSMVYNECYPLLHDEDGDIDTYGHFAAGMGIFFFSAAINISFEYFFLMRVEPKLSGLNFILIVLIYCARCLVTLLPGIHILSESYPGTQIANNYQRFMPFLGRGYGFESMEGAFIFQVFLDQLKNCEDDDSRQAFIESMMRKDRIITDVAVLAFIIFNAGLLESVCYWDVYDNIRDFASERGVCIPKTGSWNTRVPLDQLPVRIPWLENIPLPPFRKKDS